MECRLETGRTHQIRVHLSAKGHPLVGDKVYGGKQKYLKKLIEPNILQILENFPRQALHAALLGFYHPKNGKHLLFKVNLPDDMAMLLKKLQK